MPPSAENNKKSPLWKEDLTHCFKSSLILIQTLELFFSHFVTGVPVKKQKTKKAEEENLPL